MRICVRPVLQGVVHAHMSGKWNSYVDYVPAGPDGAPAPGAQPRRLWTCAEKPEDDHYGCTHFAWRLTDATYLQRPPLESDSRRRGDRHALQQREMGAAAAAKAEIDEAALAGKKVRSWACVVLRTGRVCGATQHTLCCFVRAWIMGQLQQPCHRVCSGNRHLKGFQGNRGGERSGVEQSPRCCPCAAAQANSHSSVMTNSDRAWEEHRWTAPLACLSVALIFAPQPAHFGTVQLSLRHCRYCNRRHARSKASAGAHAGLSLRQVWVYFLARNRQTWCHCGAGVAATRVMCATVCLPARTVGVRLSAAKALTLRWWGQPVRLLEQWGHLLPLAE
jgi:hypothetical protein